MRIRTVFSPANRFCQGQYVTADGSKGIALGWQRGRTGKAVVVKMTEGPHKGKRLAYRATNVAPRRGNNGRGPLMRVA